ncbi:hypothetical protein DITRI_Ditri06bG0000700 [Diplodiscus trichospermus]
MALLCFNPLPSLFSSRSTSLPISVSPVSRLRLKAIDHPPLKCVTVTLFVPNMKRMVMSVKASSESTDGEPQLPTESKKENLPVEQLPLESKMQQMMEQKMRMKLAKKIRLRRKRLVRKRKMRKKGRWPPSKMKKLKNV